MSELVTIFVDGVKLQASSGKTVCKRVMPRESIFPGFVTARI